MIEAFNFSHPLFAADQQHCIVACYKIGTPNTKIGFVVWNITSAKCLLYQQETFNFMAIAPDSSYLITTNKTTITLWNLAQKKAALIINSREYLAADITDVFFPTLDQIVVRDAKANLVCWHLVFTKTTVVAYIKDYTSKVRKYPACYQGIDITGSRGLTQAQHESLVSCGIFGKPTSTISNAGQVIDTSPKSSLLRKLKFL